MRQQYKPHAFTLHEADPRIQDTPVVADIRKEWDWVKTGVDAILLEQPQLTYRAEDVYAECISGNATLFTLGKNFVVTTIYLDRFTDNKIFLMWLAWGRNIQNGHKLVGFFERVARDSGCAYIEIYTPIDRLEKHLVDNGWRLDTRVFRRDLELRYTGEK
tara:strand:- start:6342 stop:6821 length:480 start_codon:yes stop_codon:yes gene_type:complete